MGFLIKYQPICPAVWPAIAITYKNIYLYKSEKVCYIKNINKMVL